VQAAELIRLYRLDGLTYQAFAHRLNNMGFHTRRGKAFLAMSVQRLDEQRPANTAKQAMVGLIQRLK
jgi:hypothetical protein